jgi:RNA polymerase sigma factor (sigma-70 family)
MVSVRKVVSQRLTHPMESLAPLIPTSDEHLMSQAATGDFAAFQELIARFQSRVFGVAVRIVGQRQDAEDVTQQTFLSLIEHVDSFRSESSVATWILRIAANHALKVLRKRRGLPTVAWAESTMTCEELLKALNEYVDEEAALAVCQEFAEHLAGCNPCQVVVGTLAAEIRESGLTLPVQRQSRNQP